MIYFTYTIDTNIHTCLIFESGMKHVTCDVIFVTERAQPSWKLSSCVVRFFFAFSL